MKLNIDLGKYVITGTKHDLILSERGIIKEGDNAGKETLSPDESPNDFYQNH
ncbi:hypothetical protein [Escherichia coli]|uniref:hypothetical protein n=1 Tax=Escherichia coli TaxID=562 RepID=UPI001C5CE6FA|nr:hypothetical protein [Escherichia coli]QYA31632.1 hypothetical protein JJB06_07455 [Escherichia coli]